MIKPPFAAAAAILFCLVCVGVAASLEGGRSALTIDIALDEFFRLRTESHPVAEVRPSIVLHPQGPIVPIERPAPRLGGGCLPAEKLKNARIVALGAYEGGLETSLAFQGEADPVGLIQVHGDAKKEPVVLVLAAYDPVIWDFAHFPSHRLRGLLVHGYHSQAVANLPEQVEVRFIARGNEGACGEQAFAYEGGDRLEHLNAQIAYALGHEIDAFFGGYDPAALHIEGGGVTAAPLRMPSLAQIRGSAPLAESGPIRGTGLQQLVRDGALRQAGARDVDAWNLAATRASRTGRLAPTKSDRLDARDAYVVLKPLVMPRGMHGAHSRSFIIPPGIAAPIDHGSHNAYYFVESGTCSGPAC